MSVNLEEFKIKKEQEQKKERRKKGIIAVIVTIIILAGLYAATVIVKNHNVAQLGDEHCEYNGEHPVQTGMKEETHAVCKGCSKIMLFQYTITNELCETCAQELNRCELCGGLLEN